MTAHIFWILYLWFGSRRLIMANSEQLDVTIIEGSGEDSLISLSADDIQSNFTGLSDLPEIHIEAIPMENLNGNVQRNAVNVELETSETNWSLSTSPSEVIDQLGSKAIQQSTSPGRLTDIKSINVNEKTINDHKKTNKQSETNLTEMNRQPKNDTVDLNNNGINGTSKII